MTGKEEKRSSGCYAPGQEEDYTDCRHGDSVKDEIGVSRFVVIGQSGGRGYFGINVGL